MSSLAKEDGQVDLRLGLALRVCDSRARKNCQMMRETSDWESTAGFAVIGISSVLFDVLLGRCRLPCCILLFFSSSVLCVHAWNFLLSSREAWKLHLNLLAADTHHDHAHSD